MTSRRGAARLASLVLPVALPLALLAACQSPPAPTATSAGAAGGARQGQVDAERAAFCRRRAEEIFLTQNRGEALRADSRDSPFSGPAGAPGVTRGLSDRFALDRMIADCIRNTGERTDPTQLPQTPGATGPLAPASGLPSSPKAPPPPPPVR